MYTFDAKKATQQCIAWIQDWFEKNGKGCKAVLGMSGGKDSTVAAALCAKALGKENVIGVAIPDKNQSINEADEICEYLGINYKEICIEHVTKAFLDLNCGEPWTPQTEQNMPPRVRMITLMMVAQTCNGRLADTCNWSENYIGYLTIFGDGAGMFSPLGNLTVTEVRAIGHELGIPSKWVDKTPDDGLPHSSPDEVKLGFTYAELDHYIREGIEPEPEKKEKMDRLYRINQFKRDLLHIPTFTYSE